MTKLRTFSGMNPFLFVSCRLELTKNICTYSPRRAELATTVTFTPTSLVFASRDLIKLMKTSNSVVRSGTQSRLQKLRIGEVPDRGGRPSEKRAPVSMPRFKKVQNNQT